MAGSKFLMTMKLVTQGDVIGSSIKKEGDLDYSKGMECHGFNYECVTAARRWQTYAGRLAFLAATVHGRR